MWCNSCKIETNSKKCPNCGKETQYFPPRKVYWDSEKKIPLILTDSEKELITKGSKTTLKYLATDCRPVFPEERLIVEILLGQKPNSWVNKSVFASKNRYFVDDEIFRLNSNSFDYQNTDKVRDQYFEYCSDNSYDFFNKNIKDFVQNNQNYLNELENEALEFIQNESLNYDLANIVISFSGGKDSTVTADLVLKALGDPRIVTIFGDTTLELPFTLDYVERYKKDHPFSLFKVAKNTDNDFFEMCKEVGPPARLMRWCCSTFKTGPISRVFNSFYQNEQILTFYGIRKSESLSRSKYNRVEKSSSSIKIQQQTVASPIIDWKDIDVWLYILSHKIDFNYAYRVGFDRVGCWLCPNNSNRGQFLNSLFFHENAEKWREFLLNFARQIGKPDPEDYIDSGNWKARQGGNGLENSTSINITYSNCTTDKNAKVFKLLKPYSDDFLNLLIPFGIIRKDLGHPLLDETLITNKDNIPIISVQPFNNSIVDYSVKIKSLLNLNKNEEKKLFRKISYQVRKYNACQKCLKCESICRNGAISITDKYYIDPTKCVQCQKCLDSKFIRGGCMMSKYLKAKEILL